ncbi:MAG: PIG-L family deacetylase [Chloroflexales bacterium]|nr:PIG-L family deacetylase [Chloroflexales bacterium]
MAYGVLVISAHPDDAEVQMVGTIALLADQGLRVFLVDLCDGEPSDFAELGVRAEQARHAAAHLGADRLLLTDQDRLLIDIIARRIELAHQIREHRPRIVFGTTSIPTM